jgi:hypothetical protein
MKHGEKTLACLLCSLALCGAATAVAISSENPYQMVVERNVFALKPPAPPAPDPASIKPPAPKVILNGIITLLGNKRALLKMTPPAAKGEQAKEQSYVLTEGQRDGDLEVIKIDEKAGMVTVNDFGTVTNITFDTNATKTASAPAAMPMPTGAIPPPMMPAGFTPPGGGLRSLPTRTLRLPGAIGSPPGAGLQGPATGSPSAFSPEGGMPTAAYASVAQTQSTASQPQVSPEEAMIMTEALREANKEAYQNGSAIPPPLTAVTPRGAAGTPEAAGVAQEPQPANPAQPVLRQRPF